MFASLQERYTIIATVSEWVKGRNSISSSSNSSTSSSSSSSK